MNEPHPTAPSAPPPPAHRQPTVTGRTPKRSVASWLVPACGGLLVGLLAAGAPLGLLWSDADSRASQLSEAVSSRDAAVSEAEERMTDARAESGSLRTKLKAYEQREEKLEKRAAELDERESGLDDREGEISSEEERVAQNTFGSGTHVVGTDIHPGTYRTDGGGGLCYWARLSGGGGTFGDIIANDNVDGPTTVVISPSDWGFENTRCGTWTLVE